MAPADDPQARLHGRAAFVDALHNAWSGALEPWPRLGGQNLDLYILFEAVVERAQFSLIKELMQLPRLPSGFAREMRAIYEDVCIPCERVLADAVDAVYADLGMEDASNAWLRARAVLSEEHEESEVEVQAGRDATEAAERAEFAKHPEASRAAIRSRLSIHTLMDAEAAHRLFSGSAGVLEKVDIRNHVLRMWYRNCGVRLDPRTALSGIPQRYHTLGCRIFTYLECAGLINFGAVSMVSPASWRLKKKSEPQKRVAIVGAGISGLIAARQLWSFGVDVTVYEARERPGGRVHTEQKKFSTGVDMGAMLITGIIQNPLAIVADQTNAAMHFMSSTCRIFDIDGSWVPREVDEWAEKEFNIILESTARYRKRDGAEESARFLSLGEAFHDAVERRVAKRKARAQAKRSLPLAKGVNSGELSATTGANSRAADSARYQSNGNGLPAITKSTSAESEGALAKFVKSGMKLSTTKDRSDVQSFPLKKKARLYNGDASFANGAAVAAARPSERITSVENVRPPAKQIRKPSVPKDEKLICRLLRWHIANLEYACAAGLDTVSLLFWDQDDGWSLRGEHVLLKTGYQPLVNGLVSGLGPCLRYSREVVSIKYDYSVPSGTAQSGSVSIRSIDTKKPHAPKVSEYDCVVVTAPLGVLKSGSIEFDPPLPAYKRDAIKRLGTGGLIKVAMEFDHQFWANEDMFGALRETVDTRGEFYIFWNLMPCTGKPILLALVAEPCVDRIEQLDDFSIMTSAMTVLGRCYPDAPQPQSYSISRWSKDVYASGVYSNIPVGSTGADYDFLASPVQGKLFFAGEHTTRQYPATCASAFVAGIRESFRVIEELDLVDEVYRANEQYLQRESEERSR